MGYWKELSSGGQDCEYSLREDFYVCPRCVTDQYLASLLAASLEDEPCSYCGAAKAASISLICEEIREYIMVNYVDPAEELPYEGREGGYQGDVLGTSQIVAYELDSWTDCDELADDVCDAFRGGTLWCRRNYFGLSRFEALYYSWEDFSRQVKHRTRYLFLQEIGSDSPYTNEKTPPGEMLNKLGEIFREFNLFIELPLATDLFRVRVVEKHCRPSTAAELGTAPPEKAIYPNRMSPAGIPMFYGALDEVTAAVETYNPQEKDDCHLVVARFRNTRPLNLLDLTNLPPVPSIFDEEQSYEQPRLAFLRAFEEDITKPVERSTESHLEYVPTQVVTEYVRHRLRTPQGDQLDGILYRSSRRLGSHAVVIFAEPEHCGPRDKAHVMDPESFLELFQVSYAAYHEIVADM